MKNIIRHSFALVAVAAALTVLSGCSSTKEHDHDHSGHSHSSTTSGAKPYPLSTCVVTDEKLDGHGEPVVFVHQGQEIKLCCEGCKEDFDKDPATYLKKIAAAK